MKKSKPKKVKQEVILLKKLTVAELDKGKIVLYNGFLWVVQSIEKCFFIKKLKIYLIRTDSDGMLRFEVLVLKETDTIKNPYKIIEI